MANVTTNTISLNSRNIIDFIECIFDSYEESEAYEKKGDHDPRTFTFIIKQLVNANKLNHSTKLTAQIVTSLVFCYGKIYYAPWFCLTLKNTLLKFFCSCPMLWCRHFVINVFGRDQLRKIGLHNLPCHFSRRSLQHPLFHLFPTGFWQRTYILGTIHFFYTYAFSILILYLILSYQF